MSARRDFAANQQALDAALGDLSRYLHARRDGVTPLPKTWQRTPPALERVAQRLGLSRFEQEILLLAAGAELDTTLQQVLTQLHGDAQKPWPTFALALATLPEPDWAAITPVARLRRWQLLQPAGSGSALQARLVLDEAVLHWVAGVSYPEPRLEPWITPQSVPNAQVADAALDTLGARWQTAASLGSAPVARFEDADGEALVLQLAGQLDLRLYRLQPDLLPNNHAELDALARLWEREALLRNAVLWVELDHPEPGQATRLSHWLDELQGLVVVTGEGTLTLRRTQIPIEWHGADAGSRHLHWQAELGAEAMGHLNGRLGHIAEQFQLPASAIGRIAREWQGTSARDPDALWQACRSEARHDLDQLAERVQSSATWDDLILPHATLVTLRTLAAQVRQRTTVYREWGFAQRGGRGLSISALFAGTSGTGKTLAAEVLANTLQLDLYRIDLAGLVSKYIGETEKNLARVFAVAERSGAILLFDEADALFGKRSEVRDSHDRYANLEVSYLLQRIETYRGLAILTTNLKQSIDTAFQRRLRFIVQFPFPDTEARSAIWSRVFPLHAPLQQIDVSKLARLSLSGGHIRNLALNAAFLAADEHTAIGMRHLRVAAEAEFAKLEKPLPVADVGDWA
ncbi:ATP-binding protein [Amantichitinum ursilacus]|uniref:Proteasome-associated ATPase n=1 Tax=Amantichitinum ursilacus TaxID=857265 RepID=A0A0N1JS89_9NEIS|nr:ATP-binding protein [Amantichitinum ursilacus]KPC51531.1 Proteasome-associated ATPase [Amantichitinum ursilacus]